MSLYLVTLHKCKYHFLKMITVNSVGGRMSEIFFIKMGPYITSVWKTCILACGLILRQKYGNYLLKLSRQRGHSYTYILRCRPAHFSSYKLPN